MPMSAEDLHPMTSAQWKSLGPENELLARFGWWLCSDDVVPFPVPLVGAYR
jgi:hypothetical protein